MRFAIQLSVLIFFLAPARFPALAQTPPRAIDGAEHPKFIPQSQAFLNFFLDVSDSRIAHPWAERIAYVRSAGLTEDEAKLVIDTANLVRITGNRFGRQVTVVKAAVRAGTLTSAAAQPQLDSLIANSVSEKEGLRAAMERDLGPDAYRKLAAFIDTKVKATMMYEPGSGDDPSQVPGGTQQRK